MTARRRRPPTPSPSRDWRALAADRPPCPPDPLTPPADDEHDVEVRLRRNGNDTPVVTLTGAMTTGDPAELRTLATRLHSAADALEASR